MPVKVIINCQGTSKNPQKDGFSIKTINHSVIIFGVLPLNLSIRPMEKPNTFLPVKGCRSARNFKSLINGYYVFPFNGFFE